MMNVKNLILPVAAAAFFLVPATIVLAQDATTPTTKSQKVKAPREVKFSVANKTSASVSLQAGSQQMTLAAGQSQEVKAPTGTKIVTTSESSLGASGTVVAEVTDTMGGSTVNVR